MTLWWRGRGQAVARRRRYGRLRAAAGPGQGRPGGRHAGDSQEVSTGTLAHDWAKGSNDRGRRHPFWAQASTTIHFVAEGDDMDIGKCFKDAWGLFRLDWGPLVVTALIAAVIVGVVNVVVGLAVGGSIGAINAGSFTGLAMGSALFSMVLLMVVAVVVYAWMYAVTFHMILRRVRERRAAEYADLQSFDQIGAFAVAAVILGIIIGIGYIIFVIPGLILTTIWLYALPLIGDRRIGVGEAMSESKALAARPGYFTTLVTWLVGAIVAAAVVIAAATIGARVARWRTATRSRASACSARWSGPRCCSASSSRPSSSCPSP